MTAPIERVIEILEEATITYKAAAAFIGTEQAYVRKLACTGVLERCYVHGRPLLLKSSVEKYVEQRNIRALDRAEREAEEKRPNWWAEGLDVSSKYARWNVAHLQRECRKRGLNPWLNKALLVERLKEDDAKNLEGSTSWLAEIGS